MSCNIFRKPVISSEEAINYAASAAGLDHEDYRCARIINSDGFYEVILRTIVVEFDIFVDDTTGCVRGISSEPKLDHTVIYEEPKTLAA